MIKAVIFDFDGVLAESVDIKTEAFRRLFSHEGRDAVDKIIAYHIEHGGISRFEKFRYIYKEILKRPLSNEEFSSLCKGFEELVLEGVIASPEVNGAGECLKALSGNVRLYIVSGTPQDEIRLIAKARGIENYFKGIYGAPETKTGLISKIMAEESLRADEVVFIGDAMTDYRAAMDTGVGFIARITPETEVFWKGLSVRRIGSISDCKRELGL